MPRWLTPIIALLVLSPLIVVLAGPIGPIPGIRIGGTPTPPPADRASITLPDEVQLATGAGLLPRVVNIWVVSHENALFVFGAKDSGWVKNVQARANVELRIGDVTYPLTASVETAITREVYQKYIERYRAGYPEITATMPAVDEVSEVGVIFRLDR